MFLAIQSNNPSLAATMADNLTVNALPILMDRLSNGDMAERVIVVKCMALLSKNPVSIAPLLTTALNDRELRVRYAAINLIPMMKSMKKDYFKYLYLGFAEGDEDTRARILSFLYNFTCDESSEVLKKLAEISENDRKLSGEIESLRIKLDCQNKAHNMQPQ